MTMNWQLAIEKNRAALRRIVAMLVAMVEVSGARVDTLPRHLHCFVLRLLRPAEAAARRLIIIAARGVEVEIPRPHWARARLRSSLAPDACGIATMLASGQWLDRASVSVQSRPCSLPLPLFDPLKRLGGRRGQSRTSVPRLTLDFDRLREPDP